MFSNLIDFFYPIGSIYETTDSSFNPNTHWGGGSTWEKIEGKFLLASGGGYTSGATGGEATHTLSVAEMPQHTHGSKSLSGSMTWHGSEKGGTLYKVAGIISGFSQQTNTYYTSVDLTARTGAQSFGGVSIDATHEHDAAGSSSAHNNMPPYLVINVWKRVS